MREIIGTQEEAEVESKKLAQELGKGWTPFPILLSNIWKIQAIRGNIKVTKCRGACEARTYLAAIIGLGCGKNPKLKVQISKEGRSNTSIGAVKDLCNYIRECASQLSEYSRELDDTFANDRE